ncbi:MAG: hypothetical protein IKS60_04475 [Lachnospiraceae bacterium]|nr:hypothetical protein [Lachnospiraceae bacterium]
MAKKELYNKVVLCGSNAYEKKYYFNKEFDKIPEQVKEDLHIMCVLFTEEVGGIFLIAFDEYGAPIIQTDSDENDFYYDEVSAGLLVKEVQKSKRELFEALTLYYRVFILKEDPAKILAEVDGERDE